MAALGVEARQPWSKLRRFVKTVVNENVEGDRPSMLWQALPLG